MYDGVGAFIKMWPGPLQVIVVNDGSKDNTYELLKANPVYKQHSDIISLETQENTGKGGALRNGVMKATGDFVLTLDADMASPPSELMKWMDKLNWRPDEHTIYIGSREHEESIINKQGNRKVAGNIFNLVVRVLTPLKMKDTQCGFKLYPVKLAKRYFGNLKTYGWAHDVELLYKAKLDKMNIVEMPLEWNSIEGSKIRVFRDGMKMLMETLSIVAKTKSNFLKEK